MKHDGKKHDDLHVRLVGGGSRAQGDAVSSGVNDQAWTKERSRE